MVLSHFERWVLLGALLVAAMLTLADWELAWRTIEKTTAVTFNEEAAYSSPVPAGAFEEHLLLPPSSMDARWWVIHTREMLKDGGWRVRSTEGDNAPDGREVHWSSLLIWFLAGLAHLHSLIAGGEPWMSVAWAATVVGPLLLIVSVSGLGFLVVRRLGWASGALAVVALLTTYPFVRCFHAGEADHHGLVVIFGSASVFALCAGWESAGKTSDSIMWFRWAGVLGAAALWVSAATAIPTLVGVGLGALGAGLLCRLSGLRSPAQIWLVWGRWGFAFSILFYLIEYFPDHFGWRLEVNHPLYSVAWLSSAWWLVVLLKWINGERPPRRPDFVVKAVLASAGIAMPLILVAAASEKCFWVSNDFLLALHQKFIFEFQSLPTLVNQYGGSWGWVTYYTWPVMVLVCLILIARRADWSGLGRMVIVLAPALLMQALAIYQVRWSSASFTLWCIAAIVIFGSFGFQTAVRRLGLGACWVAIIVSQIPQLLARVETEKTCLEPPIGKEVGNALLLRDIAHRLIRSSPDRLPTVLTGPNSSTDLTYHGGIRTLGTLYWENLPGLKRAAQIFSSPSADDALSRMQAAGVTHIVVPSWDSFVEAYAGLLSDAGEGDGSVGFFRSLLVDDEIPDWLRPFAYPIPTGSGVDAKSVKIFAVIPHQTLFESQFFKGLYYMESGEPEKARAAFREALRIRPGEPRVLELLGRLGDATSKSPTP
ncbi:MAG: hypothetical protein Fur0032_13290 [Terrimicrobiaceae bacterium]